MLNSLSSRLWLTYAFLAGIVLCILSAGITVYLLRNPLATRLAYQRLEAVTILFQQGAPILENRTDESLQSAAEREGAEVRLMNGIDTSDRIEIEFNPPAAASSMNQSRRSGASPATASRIMLR